MAKSRRFFLISIVVPTFLLLLCRYILYDENLDMDFTPYIECGSTVEIPYVKHYECVQQLSEASLKRPRSLVKCNEIFFTYEKWEIKLMTKTIVFLLSRLYVTLDILSNGVMGSYKNSVFNLEPKYSVRATKICGKCDSYKHLKLNNFEKYCGEDVYAHNITLQGSLLMPVREGEELMDTSLDTVVFLHGWVSPRGPSQLWPSNVFGWFHSIFKLAFTVLRHGSQGAYGSDGKSVLSMIFPVLLASQGSAVVVPDYIGYGDDKTLFKG